MRGFNLTLFGVSLLVRVRFSFFAPKNKSLPNRKALVLLKPEFISGWCRASYWWFQSNWCRWMCPSCCDAFCASWSLWLLLWCSDRCCLVPKRLFRFLCWDSSTRCRCWIAQSSSMPSGQEQMSCLEVSSLCSSPLGVLR